MLHLYQGSTGEPRLYIRHPALPVEAWIERSRSPTPHSGADWILWYRRAPHQPAHMHKSQLRLEIESALRSWLLRTYRRRLYSLNFGDLCALARASHRREKVR